MKRDFIVNELNKEYKEKIGDFRNLEESVNFNETIGFIYYGDSSKSTTLNQQEYLANALDDSSGELGKLFGVMYINKGLNANENGMEEIKNIEEAMLIISDDFSDEKLETITPEQIQKTIREFNFKTTHVIATEKELIEQTINEIETNFGKDTSIIIITPLDLETGKNLENTFKDKLNTIYYIPELANQSGILLNFFESEILNNGDFNPKESNKIIGKFFQDKFSEPHSLLELFTDLGVFGLLVNPLDLKLKVKRLDAAINLYNFTKLEDYFMEAYKQEIETALVGTSIETKSELLIELQKLKETNKKESLLNIDIFNYSVNPNAIFSTSGSSKILENMNLSKNSYTAALFKTANETKGAVAINTIGKLINNIETSIPKVLFLGITDSKNTQYKTNAGYYGYIFDSLKVLNETNDKLGLKSFELYALDHLILNDNGTNKLITLLDDNINLEEYDVIVVGANHEVYTEDYQISYMEICKNYNTEKYLPIFNLDKNLIYIAKKGTADE